MLVWKDHLDEVAVANLNGSNAMKIVEFNLRSRSCELDVELVSGAFHLLFHFSQLGLDVFDFLLLR